jgi:hypothetical protein
VRIWNYARTQQEIENDRNRAVTSGTGLLGRWGFDEGSGTTSANSVPGGSAGTLTNGPVHVLGAPPWGGQSNAAPTATAVTITGTANVGHLLTGSYTYQDAEGDTESLSSFRWLRDSQPVAGEDGLTYLLTVVDLGASMTFEVRPAAHTGTSPGSPATSTPVGPVTGLATIAVTFQEGVDGYAGTMDTHIRQAAASNAHGALESLEWDAMEGTTGSEKYALLRFGGIFGTGDGQVPPGAPIASAELRYVVWNPGDSALCNEVSVDWNENVTYNTFGATAGVQPADYGALVGSAYGAAAATYSLNVTGSVAAWSEDSTENRGWIFRHTGTNGVDLRSSEYMTIADRPMLIVTYVTDNHVPNPPLLTGPADGSTGVPLPVPLSVSVSDPDAEPLTVSYYGRAVLSSSREDFTVIKLPDTQFYSGEMNGGTNAHFKAQTQWINDNRGTRSIAYVQHVGDIVQSGESVPVEWSRADTSISILEQDPTLPFGLCVGNHDIGSAGSTLLFNETFGVNRFSARPWYGGHYGSTNDNSFAFFTGGGMDFIAISLKYGSPIPAAVLHWADSLLKAHPGRRAIVSSHWILEVGNPGAFSATGQAIYDSLKDNPNLFLLLCGHRHGEGRRADTYNGRTVHTILADYQSRTNGGDGWLRIMEFSPANNKIRFRTYSPTLDQYEADSDSSSQFTIPYDMEGGAAFQLIARHTGIPSGSSDVFAWPALSPGTTYEWHVEVSDGISTVRSETRTFTTEGPADISLSIKVMLQGAWNGSGMDTALASQGFVPVSQPYHGSPWNHSGAETVLAVPAGVVDWVLVDLRTDGTAVAARRAAFLTSDGTVTDLDGVSAVRFGPAAPGSYYLAVLHRNHIGVLSAVPIPLSGGTVLYDFTDWSGGPRAWGDQESMADLGPGVRGMWSGDADANGGVGASDLVAIRVAIGAVGYISGDIDMNTGVGASDLVVTRVNIGRSLQIP